MVARGVVSSLLKFEPDFLSIAKSADPSMQMTAATARPQVDISIGGVTIGVRTSDDSFVRALERRYGGFVDSSRPTDFTLDIDLTVPGRIGGDEDVRVFREGSRWKLERGDFRAVWEPIARHGRIRQSANPYSLDAVLRIVHTLVLAREGGLLVHASSIVRHGRAFLFAGVSGAGKTTISRLAPPDAHLLTDEISYVRKESGGYFAYGTPFVGDLGRAGENLRAPLAAVYLLAQGAEHRIDSIAAADAARGLLSCILFFADDAELVQAVFQAALDFVERVPVKRLTFMPDTSVWDLIG